MMHYFELLVFLKTIIDITMSSHYQELLKSKSSLSEVNWQKSLKVRSQSTKNKNSIRYILDSLEEKKDNAIIEAEDFFDNIVDIVNSIK